MNVNDVVCVGAEPLAVLDYLAVEEADPELLRQIGEGLKAGAERAGVEVPGGELAQLPESFRVRAIVPLTVPGLDAERHLVLLERR
jgi:phosphoribosylformylglycinamidine cyclo-ligase